MSSETVSASDLRAQQLQQVALCANVVSRLSFKSHNQGGLTKNEQRLLDDHLTLLRQEVLLTQGPLFFIPSASAAVSAAVADQDEHQPRAASSLIATLADIKCRDEVTARASTSAATTAAEERARSPAAAHRRPGSPHRRRTKRVFDNRVCQHCATHYTSQWRTGPSGPSTLCNACGIRYARQVKQTHARQADSPTASAASSPIETSSPPLSPPLRASVHFLLN